jgi:hypothetical protein
LARVFKLADSGSAGPPNHYFIQTFAAACPLREVPVLTEVRSQTRALRMGGGLALAGIAMALTACGPSGTPTGSSSSGAGVVTTMSGGDTCAARANQHDASPDFYQQQYATGLANQLNDKLKTYDSALDSLDPHNIGDAAGALDSEVRADARLVNVPRLYGCYDPKILTGLQNATNSFAEALDALSCAGNNLCNRKPTEVAGLVATAKPQERTYVQAINAYAAQFGGEQLPLPKTPLG